MIPDRDTWIVLNWSESDDEWSSPAEYCYSRIEAELMYDKLLKHFPAEHLKIVLEV